MPDVKTHCDISKRRTKGKDDFKELHEWMDEGVKYLKHNHRLERHFFTQEYKDFIKEKWGSKAVVEWLFHIALDNLETANKFALETYSSPFEDIEFIFEGETIKGCNFKKVSHDSIKIISYEKEQDKKEKEES